MSREIWLVICAWGVLVLRAGMAVHESGSVRAKNSASALIRNLASVAVGVVAFWAVGGALFMGPKAGGIFSIECGTLVGWKSNAPAATFFAMTAMLLASGIVSGVVAERSRFAVSAWASGLLGALLVPLAAYWARTGWLGAIGFHDLGGASFIHLAGACSAAVGAVVVGARMGKFNRDGSSSAIPGHNMPLVSTGLLLMATAWLPYLLGFSLLNGNAEPVGALPMNVMLAAASAMLAAMVFGHLRYGKVDVHLVYSALLGSLVAISAGADVLGNWAAVVIGVIVGFVVPLAVLSIDLLWRIDDPSSGIAVHGVASVVGILGTGLLGPASGILGRLKFLGVQTLGIVVIGALAILLSLGLFAALKAMGALRSLQADEFDGLDLAEHDIGAYPDFQQTTIKSYHLREA